MVKLYANGVKSDDKMLEALTGARDRLFEHHRQLLEYLATQDIMDALEKWRTMCESNQTTALRRSYNFWPEADFLLDVGLGLLRGRERALM